MWHEFIWIYVVDNSRLKFGIVRGAFYHWWGWWFAPQVLAEWGNTSSSIDGSLSRIPPAAGGTRLLVTDARPRLPAVVVDTIRLA